MYIMKKKSVCVCEKERANDKTNKEGKNKKQQVDLDKG